MRTSASDQFYYETGSNSARFGRQLEQAADSPVAVMIVRWLRASLASMISPSSRG